VFCVLSRCGSCTFFFFSNSYSLVTHSYKHSRTHARTHTPTHIQQELGKSPTAVARAEAAGPVIPKKSKEEVQSLVPTILAETDAAKQAEQWKELKESQSVTAFGSANIRTFPVTLQMLEQRTGLTAETLGLAETEVSLDDFKYATLYVAGGSSVAAIASLAFLPPNVGATLCYIFALIPIVFLGIGSTAPVLIANAIAGLRGDGSDADAVSSRERRSRHEAAHFCCGYWCGLPVASYSVGDDDSVPCVEFGVASNNNYSNTEVAALAVTALAGLVGEAKKWGKAVGATQDLMTLEAIFRRSGEFIGAAAQQDITRWGAMTACLLLKQNEEKYEQVVEAFQQQKSIEECIAILET